MNPNDPPFNAKERDIDLMLLEEMHCSPTFVSWIAECARLKGASLHVAHHSVYRGNGETDILALIDTPDGRVALMIEDKIGAEMQPQQAERYRERGKALCDADGSLKCYRTLLCAPQTYLLGVPDKDWDATLSFEDIAGWFERQQDVRSNWRRDTLTRAATRLRRSLAGTLGSPIEIGEGTIAKFKQDYRAYVMSKYKQFVLSVQTGRDKEYYFRGTNFPSYMNRPGFAGGSNS